MLAGPAVKDFYTIAGRRILIEAEDDYSAQAVSNFLGWTFLTPVADDANRSSDAAIRIRLGTPPRIPTDLFQFGIPHGGVCHTDSEAFHFDFGGSVMFFGPGKPRDVDVWITKRYEPGSRVLYQIISQALDAALRSCDVYEFHSAAVAPLGYDSAVLVAGPSGSGKSTLTMQLAACGWRYLSDDSVLLGADGQGVEVHALTRFFGLRADTISALRLPEVSASLSPRSFKARFSPQDLFPTSQIMRAHPRAILFTNVTQKATTHIVKLGSSEAMTRLLRLCPWAGYDKPTARNHLRLLAQLAGDCIPFDLFAGTDVLDNKDAVAELLLAKLAIG